MGERKVIEVVLACVLALAIMVVLVGCQYDQPYGEGLDKGLEWYNQQHRK